MRRLSGGAVRRLSGGPSRGIARSAATAASAVAVAFAGGCAQPAPPPGGPPDPRPPAVVSVSPDSGATGVRAREVEFRFDEVVAERPARGATLGALVLVSPRQGEPEVRWRRDRITVRPDGGFRDNTVYVVQLLPGVADLRGNVRDSAATTVFSTGATIPATRVTGVVFDWVAQRAIPNALVQAVTRPDSVVYVTLADSSGRFVLPHVPPGPITVVGIGDADNDFALDEREQWDSVSVTLADSARVELYAFVRDTVGPVVRDVALRDSVTIRLTLDRPLDVRQRVDTALVHLLTADSAAVPVASVTAVRDTAPPVPTPALDTLPADTLAADTLAARAARPARADTAAADTTTADTTRRLPPPVPTRPPPVTEIEVRAARALTPGQRYVVRLVEARNLLGHARTSDRSFQVPQADTTARPAAPPPPPDTTGTAPAPPASVPPASTPPAGSTPAPGTAPRRR